MESRNVAAMIHRHATFRIQPVRTKRNHPSTCHPDRVKRAEGSTQVASFPLWWFLYQRGGFLHSANATVGMTDVFALVVTNSNVQRIWRQICRRYIAWYHSTAQVIFATWRAADCRPYDTFVPFYRIVNVFITNLRFENCQLSTVHCQFKSFLTRWPDYC